jgi:hypothetical protein
MPALYDWSAEHGLIVGRLSGLVEASDVITALGAAIADGRYPAGEDRITVVEPGARLHRLELDGLRRIQTVVAANERSAAQEPRYRSALVCDDAVKRPIIELYRMLWTAGPFGGVAYRVASDEASALSWLGRPPDALDAASPPLGAAAGDG